MKYLIEISEETVGEAEILFKNTGFIKKFRKIASNEITNQAIIESIEAYETGRVKPSPVTLQELKDLLNA